MSIAVISTIYGSYDDITKPVDQTIDSEWIMVTDKKIQCSPWHNIVEPRPHLPPQMAAKVAKACPDLYSDADVLIYIDGNMQVTSSKFLEWCLDCLGDNVLACHHIWRRGIDLRIEASCANQLEKYRGQEVIKQAEYYYSQGSDYGIWGSNFMIRSKDCPKFGPEWLAEMMRWSAECQISLPYVLRKYGISPNTIPRVNFPVDEYITFNLDDEKRWERRSELTQGIWWSEIVAFRLGVLCLYHP